MESGRVRGKTESRIHRCEPWFQAYQAQEPVAGMFRARQLHAVLRLTPLTMTANVANAVLVSAAFWNSASHPFLVVWTLVVALQAALAHNGHVDVWVNNVGRGISRPVSELTDEDLDEMVLVHVQLYGQQAQRGQPKALVMRQHRRAGQARVSAPQRSRHARMQRGQRFHMGLIKDRSGQRRVGPGHDGRAAAQFFVDIDHAAARHALQRVLFAQNLPNLTQPHDPRPQIIGMKKQGMLVAGHQTCGHRHRVHLCRHRFRVRRAQLLVLRACAFLSALEHAPARSESR